MIFRGETMIIGKVVGNVFSTRKCQSLVGYKLLVIKPLFGNKDDFFVAADTLGAGIGECVLVTTDNTTQYALDRQAPIDAIVVGIIDEEPQLEG